ncbi:diguanylate cyclase [Celeribacter indicus]|uniref:diguanylate cyclase n=2 Tax=Celeribacter indicus TaxID=1208324 RepID=A0A0B5E3W5_9RHOB|nr:diguanylate cyclase [Celeribacter indicus]AJE48060.1 response regulator [Celeribacter indicus]SDW31505.1 response regulator receiver modulated diguanylate cyclase [Celeribacter indicus]
MTGSILIADNVPTNRIILKVKLSSAFYEVTQATSGAEALARARSERPNLVLLDIDLGDMTGYAACAALKADPLTAHIAVAIITPPRDQEAKIAALKAGADEVLGKPLDAPTLSARVRALMRASATSGELRRRGETVRALGFAEAPATFGRPGRITLVGSTAEEAMGWRVGLRGMIHDEIVIERREKVLRAVHDGAHSDLYVISTRPGTGEGLRLISDLRAREATRHAGIIVVHGQQERREALMALDLGANDLITRGADPEEMALRLRTQMRRKRDADLLRQILDEGLRLVSIDSLTRLYNRRYALAHLEKIAEEARTGGRHFALMLIDIDRFKSVNDTFGHAVGDAVLAEVGQRLRDSLRGMDLVARFGGEEFLVCMPMTSLTEARAAAERLRVTICDRPMTIAPDGTPVTVSVSIGLAMGGGPDRSAIPDLLAVADQALYSAKAEGRNQVTLGSHAA